MILVALASSQSTSRAAGRRASASSAGASASAVKPDEKRILDQASSSSLAADASASVHMLRETSFTIWI
jgi:hypothetical protein